MWVHWPPRFKHRFSNLEHHFILLKKSFFLHHHCTIFFVVASNPVLFDHQPFQANVWSICGSKRNVGSRHTKWIMSRYGVASGGAHSYATMVTTYELKIRDVWCHQSQQWTKGKKSPWTTLELKEVYQVAMWPIWKNFKVMITCLCLETMPSLRTARWRHPTPAYAVSHHNSNTRFCPAFSQESFDTSSSPIARKS